MSLPYHKRWHSDALSGMMPLNLEERGAYNTLLDLIYDHGGPIADNERLIAGYMNCSTRKWRAIRQSLVDKSKIRITSDGLISNARAKKEIENQMKTHRKRAESGSKGGRTRAEKEKKGNEINEGEQAPLEAGLSYTRVLPESRSQSSEDKSSDAEASQIVIPDQPAKPPPPDDPIKQLFDTGVALLTGAGKTESQARSLIGKWRKDRTDGEVLTALIECKTRMISEPVEWLTKRLKTYRYVSPSGYEYRGDIDDVIRESEKRADWSTHWKAKGDLQREREGAAADA